MRAVAGYYAVGHRGVDVGHTRAKCAVHKKALSTIVVDLTSAHDHPCDGGGANGLDKNAATAVIRNQRIRHLERAACTGKELDAVPGMIAHDAVGDGQRKAGVETQPDSTAETDPLDGDAAQVDVPGAIRGIDDDAGATP